MLKTFACVDRDASFDRFDPEPLPISAKHLQAKNILFKEHRQTTKVGMSADIVGFSNFVILAGTRIIDHPANKVLRWFIIVMHLKEVIFWKLEDDGV